MNDPGSEGVKKENQASRIIQIDKKHLPPGHIDKPAP
jgi:hypothetical protein